MTVILTDAYQEAFKKGYALMTTLPDVLEQEEHIIVNLLRDAASCFIEANKLQPDQAQPYLMLASIYLGMGKLDLVQKYIERAEKIESSDPALLYLKDYLSNPFARLFTDILPLMLSAGDLQDWIKDVFEYSTLRRRNLISL